MLLSDQYMNEENPNPYAIYSPMHGEFNIYNLFASVAQWLACHVIKQLIAQTRQIFAEIFTSKTVFGKEKTWPTWNLVTSELHTQTEISTVTFAFCNTSVVLLLLGSSMLISTENDRALLVGTFGF